MGVTAFIFPGTRTATCNVEMEWTTDAVLRLNDRSLVTSTSQPPPQGPSLTLALKKLSGDHLRLPNSIDLRSGPKFQTTHTRSMSDADNNTSMVSGSLPCPPVGQSHPLFPHQSGQFSGLPTGSQGLGKRRSLQHSVTPFFRRALRRPRTAPAPAAGVMSPHQGTDTESLYPFNPFLSHASASSSQQDSISQPPSSPITLDDPPPFLLDDDPFANLSPPAIISSRSSHGRKPSFRLEYSALPPIELPPPTVPRSPLSPPNSATSSYFGMAPPTPPRARSLGKLKPAYERPAFSTRPSLPSLDTLARTNIVPPNKVRRGKVGAQLPFEPWESVDSEEGGMSGTETPCVTRPASPSTILAQIRAQYAENGPSDMGSIEAEFLDDDEPPEEHPAYNSHSSRFTSDRDSFTFFDNLSTPSLECSSVSLSRSLSLESMTLSDISPGNSDPERLGRFVPELTTNRSSRDQAALDPLSLPSPFYLGPTIDHANNLPIPQPRRSVETIYESTLEQDSPTQDSMLASRPFSATRYSEDSHLVSCRTTDSYADGPSNRGSGGDGGAWVSGHSRGDDDSEEPSHRRPLALSESSSTPETSSGEEDSEEDYGQPISDPRACAPDPMQGNGASSEDDVPLAQRIPTALQAQRTIRNQFREERDRRRRERALKIEQDKDRLSPPPPPQYVTGSPEQMIFSASQEPASQAPKQRVQTRSRTRTLPSSTPRPFAPEELARKLQDVQVGESSRAHHGAVARVKEDASRGRDREGVEGSPVQLSQPTQSIDRAGSAFEASSRPLRAMRSFHHSERRNAELPQNTTSPVDPTHNSTRRVASTRVRSRVREEQIPPPPSAWQPLHLPTTRASSESPTSSSPVVPPLPQPRQSGETQRKLTKAQPSAPLKTSAEPERSPKSPMQPSPGSINFKTQQRIFIGDMQRFNVVEVDNSTSAEDVVIMIRGQGSLNGLFGPGDWMLYEVAQDFGMERPIRGYELLSDIQASWNKDKLVNMFVLKTTPLAIPLSREAIPSSSPTYGSYVEWESKRGKWNKRWLRLREHSLWLSKRDNGKDEILLCSLSNFDGYTVTRAYKAPKPFVFAIKSTDNLSLFENTADYMHVFSCQPQDGHKWLEKILIARSYVLYQERNVLFNPKTTNGNAPGNVASISRAGTRKVRPAQPLVDVAPPYAGASQQQHLAHLDVFEPGSLLAKS